MAAAAAAALRLGGRMLLRRTQQQGRRVFSDPQRRLFADTSATAPQAKQPLAIRLAEMKVKKEELYNMGFSLATEYDLPRGVRRENKELLELLSVQVQPRPNDVYWMWRWRMERMKRFVIIWGVFTLVLKTAEGGVQILSKEIRLKRRNGLDDFEDWWSGKKSWSQQLHDWWNSR
ncbi:hypothetical protein CFC21_004557 [Triticum aestivum]|uniref:Uncharacterized protein n=2 Tax=Triticum TaxID=4564 RepID=A0A9R0V0V5_TRITD|nr:uncharacterized protein LOC123183472 isoform X1 [Triticum aestivum]KAF6986845.1 hypothetical protein CFC21_004557 [Triticum aestivum]VAH11737.1 unnamed protein product [Triticum turgidum subsp. durum]